MALKPTSSSSVRLSTALPAELERLRAALDDLVLCYKAPAYIPPDPLSIPYRYIDDARACELVAFVAAMFSYGRRDLIIPAVNRILAPMDQDPAGFIDAFDPRREGLLYRDFVYRFNKGGDVVAMLGYLKRIYGEYGSLEALFAESWEKARRTATQTSVLKTATGYFMDAFEAGEVANKSYGLKFILPHPDRGGACKRFHMFLRWMVRQDRDEASGQVDLGLWKNALSPADLLIPLDTHVMQMSIALNLSSRKTGSWQTAEDITAVLRRLNPADPVRYDYALFGFSLEHPNKTALSRLRLKNRYD